MLLHILPIVVILASIPSSGGDQLKANFLPPTAGGVASAPRDVIADMDMLAHPAPNRTNITMIEAWYDMYLSTVFGGERNVSEVFDVIMTSDGGGVLEGATDVGNTGTIAERNRFRGRRCLDDMNNCRNQSDAYHETLEQLGRTLFRSAPPLDLTQIDGVSKHCRWANARYLDDLHSFQYWALKMYDASAKISSGLLSGNVNHLGDFDTCMRAVNADNREASGSKYCLASVQVETPAQPYLAGLHTLLHAHNAFVSNLRDPGHRVPRFSSINWAVCMPDACSARDLELGMRAQLERMLGDHLQYQLEVDPHMCTSSKPDAWSWSFVIVSVFFISVFLLAVYATFYDDSNANTDKNQWILAFSLKKNVRHLLDTKRAPNDLVAVHGIRFLNAVMLILAHKSMALLFQPYVNRTQMTEIIGQPWTVIGRAASLYTDPFIMLSGTLTAYSLIGRLQRGVKLNLGRDYVARLFRIVPTLGALILFCTFVLPHLGSGPMWNQVVTHHSHICKRNWWRNLMFIHNYFGFEEMCLTHTHHVGIDTQLFFASPFMVLLIWKWPRVGLVSLLSLAGISTVMRYYVTYTMKLSNYVHFGTSIQQLFGTADNMYILPAHRLTVYIMGILLAYTLRYYKDVKLNPILLYIGNIFAGVSFIVSLTGASFMGDINYVYNPLDAAWYAAGAPILWCFAFAWVIFTTHAGYVTPISTLTSLPIFRIWTKISYTVYLTQFPIFFYNVGTTKHSDAYHFFNKNLNFWETVVILIVSAMLTLLFETPFQNIKNVIFAEKKSASSNGDVKHANEDSAIHKKES